MIVTPVSESAVRDRRLDRRRPAVFRQQGGVHVECPETRYVQERLREDLAVRRQRKEVERPGTGDLVDERAQPFRLVHAQAENPAPLLLPASAASLCPRPAGRSGCVTTPASAVFAANDVQDSARQTRSCRKTASSIGRLSTPRQRRLRRSLDFFVRRGRANVFRLVDVQHAVEMVDLVLKALREQAFAFQTHFISVAVEAATTTTRLKRAISPTKPGTERQPSVISISSSGNFEFRD